MHENNSVVERDYLALIGIKYAHHFRLTQSDETDLSKGQALGKMAWYLVNSSSVLSKENAQALEDLITTNEHGAFDETDVITLCGCLYGFIHPEENSRRFDEKLAEESSFFRYIEELKKGKNNTSADK